MWNFNILVCLTVTIIRAAEIEVVYEIPQGKIMGHKTTTAFNGVTYYSFKGIPYSKPKVGVQKFDPPEYPDKWEGVFDATTHGNQCIQYDPIFRTIKGDDDCLFVNVYTTDMSTESCKPVMVWIHGGAFAFGSGNDDIYGPDYLIEHNIVLVTMNYRLGPIGFINTQDENSRANLGLKDQSYALRWVKHNIEYFGGCLEQITIFGESAGSASVHYHLLSPMSKGYFDKSIQQSGTATDEWAFSYYPRKAAFDLGKKLGINSEDSAILMNSLAQLDSAEILKVSESSFQELDLEAILTWIPSVEPSIEGVEVFLSDHPMTLIRNGKINDVPMMAGVNLDECALFLHEVMNHIEQNSEFIYNEMHTLLPNNMNITDVQEAKKVAKDIYKFYFGDKNITRDLSDKVLELLNDGAFFIQYHITTLIAGEHIKSPIYKYLLTHRNDVGVIKTFKNLGNVSSHTDDLEYLWHWRFISNLPDKDSPMEFLVRLFTKLWTNFAKYGNPTHDQDEVVNFIWKPMGKDNNILHIDMKPHMEKGFFNERMQFWVKLYNSVLGEFSELLTINVSAAVVCTFTFSLISLSCYLMLKNIIY